MSACNCCDHFSASVVLECRSAGAVCESPAPWCFPPFGFPDLPEWEDGACYSAAEFFGVGHAGSIIASNFAGEDGRIVPGFPFDKRHGEWRIAHDPSMTCFLRVWYRVWENTLAAPSWTPPISDSESYSDDVYVWEGSGNPCLAEPSLSVLDAANRIFSSVGAVSVPSQRTLVSVEILKFSYLDGYEPDISDPDNPQPNGFPDPSWEPAAP